jgi:chorismate synthase
MLRFLTAGESHGPALTAILEGMVAGVPVSAKELRSELARRRHGYGRGTRMKLEEDALEIIGGVRHGRTLGSPVAVVIRNTEWPKWERVMAPGEDDAAFDDPPLTKPRPGHADLPGMLKYGYADARPILERASARETAARVAVGTVCKAFLGMLDIRVVSHVTEIGSVASGGARPGPDDLEAVDASRVRCIDASAEERMVALIDETRRRGDTLGGVFEVLAYGVPPGLGSHVHWDRKVDARLAAAMMSIHAVKGVEIGPAFDIARASGAGAHDEIGWDADAGYVRGSERSGGTEGGITTGQTLAIRGAMKPLSSLARSLPTVDVKTKQEQPAITQRSDVCAVPAAGVVGEAMVAFVLADAALEKFGGDTIAETRAALDAYRRALRDR